MMEFLRDNDYFKYPEVYFNQVEYQTEYLVI